MSKKEETAQYVSKYAQLRIVLKPAYTSEVHGRVVTHPGHDVRFADGVFTTDDPAVIEQLEARPEFGSVFIKVPSDTEALAHRDEMMKDLETKEAELKAKEEELARREAKLNAEETGRTASAGEVSDDLVDLNRPALNEIAEAEGLEPEAYKIGVSNDAVVEAIRAKRAENAPAEGGEEGAGKTDDPAY